VSQWLSGFTANHQQTPFATIAQKSPAELIRI